MKDRIYIFTAQQLCALCRKECEKYGCIVTDCDTCTCTELPHTTKNKAIEKMAKAICSTNGRRCEQCPVQHNQKSCKSNILLVMPLAQSALDALLEAKK